VGNYQKKSCLLNGRGNMICGILLMVFFGYYGLEANGVTYPKAFQNGSLSITILGDGKEMELCSA